MDKAAVDWSMGARNTKLIDWGTASRVGRRMAGGGPPLTALDRTRLDQEFADAVSEADALAASVTQLPGAKAPSRAWVMSRGQWIDANVGSMERVLEPLAARILKLHPRPGNDWRTRALGGQVGFLFGYVSRKVLGQYDLFQPPDDEGLLYFVGPNVLATERRFRFDRGGFRLWLALHEVTHRVQFASAPWLRTHVTGMIDEYLATVELEPQRVMDNLRRAVSEMLEGGEWRSMGIIFALMTPEQRVMFDKMQATMSLLEGHASFVMNAGGRERIRDFDRMKRGLEERRKTRGLEKSFQRAIGFESKLRQYGTGERFVSEVVEKAGMEAFNAVWKEPANLPTLAEIADPGIWLARVAPG
ncbi:MAG: zinc-dependent metalloprotease [Actinomycetota bacterium]